MRPRSADTSDPACVNRKMLSMKSSVSAPSTSRKYSATVKPASAGWLGHLSVNQRSFRFRGIARFNHAGLGHFQPQVVTFTGALSDASENRKTSMLLGNVVDQFHDDDGLADSRATE